MALASLLNFFKSSKFTPAIPNFLAYSKWLIVPITHNFILDLQSFNNTEALLNLFSFSIQYKILVWGSNGQFDNTPTLSDTALSNPITTTRSTQVDHTVTTYPAEFDSTTGILSQRSRVYQGYFDYNKDGFGPVIDNEYHVIKKIKRLKTHTNIFS